MKKNIIGKQVTVLQDNNISRKWYIQTIKWETVCYLEQKDIFRLFYQKTN